MVDGNVIRVIARVRAIAANPKDSVTVKKFWLVVTSETTLFADLFFHFKFSTKF